MRTLTLTSLLIPLIAAALGLVMAVVEDAVTSPFHPATLLPAVAGRVADVASALRHVAGAISDW